MHLLLGAPSPIPGMPARQRPRTTGQLLWQSTGYGTQNGALLLLGGVRSMCVSTDAIPTWRQSGVTTLGVRIQRGDLLSGELIHLDGMLLVHSLGTTICRRHGGDHRCRSLRLMLLRQVGM